MSPAINKFMKDIVELIKNLQTLTVDNSAFEIIKDFERVLDEMDIYVYKNWEDGELLSGPHANRYDITCQFMWPRSQMPDPEGGQTLYEYGCTVQYQKSHVMVPRKVRDPSDFRPGTKKGKIDLHPIWIVTISMPKKLMQDIYQGHHEKQNNRMGNLMRYDQGQVMTTQQVQPEGGNV
jgi:hypothetical protein